MIASLSDCVSRVRNCYRRVLAPSADLILPSGIGSHLQSLAAERLSGRIHSQIKLGDLILFGDRVTIKNSTKNVYFRIDDLSVTDRITCQAGEELPLKAIFEGMQSLGSSDRVKFFRTAAYEENSQGRIYRYSDRVVSGKGACIDKALMLQLIAQQKYESYLVIGQVKLSDREAATKHAFNVILMGNKPYLVDATNPLEVRYPREMVKPYVVPLKGIKAVADNYELILPEQQRDHRTYYLIDRCNPLSNRQFQ